MCVKKYYKYYNNMFSAASAVSAYNGSGSVSSPYSGQPRMLQQQNYHGSPHIQNKCVDIE